MGGGYRKEQLLDRLKALQIDFVSYDHPAVLTVEAQAKYVGHLGGALSKNLFLKDKKQRYYIVSALSGTNVDLKVLSQRLGLGKGGLRMAPEEALQEMLQVPLGCVTPFALINESARAVSLLLDRGFKAHKLCFFHPLSNEVTISLNSCDLDKFLGSIGRSPAYVDLEAAPTVGKDQPPDLAFLVPSEASEKVTHNQADKKDDQADKKVAKPLDDDSSRLGSNKTKAASPADVGKLVEEIMSKTCISMLNEVNKDSVDQYKVNSDNVLGRISRKIQPDLENIAMTFKNAAYTEGFHAGLRSRR